MLDLVLFNENPCSQRPIEQSEKLPLRDRHAAWEGSIDWTQQQGVAELKVKAQGKSIERQLETIDRELAELYRTTATEELLKTVWSGETQAIDVQARSIESGIV